MLRAWGADRFEVYSAGTDATLVRPEAIAVMAELGHRHLRPREQDPRSVPRDNRSISSSQSATPPARRARTPRRGADDALVIPRPVSLHRTPRGAAPGVP